MTDEANMAATSPELPSVNGTGDADAQARQLAEVLRELQLAQAELNQAHKLSAIGQLAAGVAHEINTPIQYVGDNVAFLERVFANLLPVIESATQLVGGDETALERMRERLAKVKFARIAAQVPRALEQSLEGIARVSKIVGAMKEFSHPSGGEKVEIDLRKAIESTATIARNEWKYVADLDVDIPADLPPLLCLRDELNQVILNLVVNAAHAIADVVGDATNGRGLIGISARADDEWCEIRISDSGTGIPVEARAKIFDPFFTTKAVGKGTGQGLAIAYHVVVERHGGAISFETELGVGTTFIVRIPRVPAARSEAA